MSARGNSKDQKNDFTNVLQHLISRKDSTLVAISTYSKPLKVVVAGLQSHTILFHCKEHNPKEMSPKASVGKKAKRQAKKKRDVEISLNVVSKHIRKEADTPLYLLRYDD